MKGSGIGSVKIAKGALTTCDSSEPLLSSCVPYLQLHPLSVQQELLYFKVNSRLAQFLSVVQA